MRTELNVLTGEVREVPTTPYMVNGSLVLIDDGQAVPSGATQPPSIDPNTVPQVVTRRQALLALLAAGKLDQVEAVVAGSPREAQIAWEAAGTFERNSPLIAALAPQVGFTDADVDNLFIEAAKL